MNRKSERDFAKYSPRYPFESLLEFPSTVRQFFSHLYQIKAKLVCLQNKNKVNALVQTSPVLRRNLLTYFTNLDDTEE